MADELRFYGLLSQTGLTVTARVYDGATQIGTDVTCTESGSLAIYLGDMPTASAGQYVVRFLSAGEVVAHSVIDWNGSAELNLNDALTAFPPSAAAIAAEVRTELSTELGRIDADVSSAQTPATVNANITQVNSVAIDGAGTEGDPFGPA